MGWLITDPNAEIELIDMVEGSGTVEGDFSLSGIGAGVTHFIMPLDMYMTGSLGFGALTFDFGGLSLESDAGFSLDAAIGKEWFVSDRRGIGVAVGLTYHAIGDEDPDIDEKWSGISIPVRFSATFNSPAHSRNILQIKKIYPYGPAGPEGYLMLLGRILSGPGFFPQIFSH